MRWGRRGVLRALTGLTGVGVAGRASALDQDPVRSGGGAERRGSVATTASDETTRAARQESTRNPALASRTAAVADEIDWFATEYPRAIETFRAAMRRGARAAGALRDESSVSVEQARALQTTFDEVVETVRDALAPHFLIHHGIRDRTETHTATVRRFARRRDTDRVKEELRRLERYASGRASDVFTDRELPRVPIIDRFIQQLRAGPFQERRPLMFRVFHGPTGFRSYVYQLQEFGRYPFYRPGFRNEIVATFDPRFEALDAPEGRLRRYYVSVFQGQGDRPDAFGSRSPQPREEQVCLIQRYPDPSTARAAYDRVVSRDGIGIDAFRESPYALGDSRWDRVFYQHDGDTLYTVFTLAGRFLLATGASRTAWEERVDWDRVLQRTFLAGE